MGNIEIFEILLEKEPPIYHPGDRMFGKVRVKLRNKLKINFIKIIVNGYASVIW